MLEGLAFLISIYALTMLLPAIGKMRRMLSIKRTGKSTVGVVARTDSTRNMLAGPLGGTAYRATIQYNPGCDEPYELFFRDHNLLMSKTYTQGDSVEVIYDVQAPYRAYTILEWKAAIRDFWNVAICLVLVGFLVFVGQVLLKPVP